MPEQQTEINAVATDEQTVIRVLRSHGFAIAKTFKNHLVVDAVASSRKVEQLFKTTINNVSQGRFGSANLPVTVVTVPASLAPYVRGISLDNVVNMLPPHR